MAPHSHRASNITLVVGGDLQECIEGTVFSARTLSVVLKPSGIEHNTLIGARGLRTFMIELDAPAEKRLRRAGVLDRGRWIDDPELAATLAAVWASEPHGAVQSLGACLSRLPALLARVHAKACVRIPESVERGMALLDRQFHRPIGPADLAEAMRMHPVSVTRAFTRVFGQGVKARLRGIRVGHAAAQLAATDAPLARIALNCGYCDQAHLCRDFRRTLGLTPGMYRRLARAN